MYIFIKTVSVCVCVCVYIYIIFFFFLISLHRINKQINKYGKPQNQEKMRGNYEMKLIQIRNGVHIFLDKNCKKKNHDFDI